MELFGFVLDHLFPRIRIRIPHLETWFIIMNLVLKGEKHMIKGLKPLVMSYE